MTSPPGLALYGLSKFLLLSSVHNGFYSDIFKEIIEALPVSLKIDPRLPTVDKTLKTH